MSDVKINSGTANVLEFRKLVANDQALQTEIAKTVGNGSWDPAAIIKLGEANGLSFTSDDIVNNLFEEDDELSDFELEMVAAGVPQTCISGEL